MKFTTTSLLSALFATSTLSSPVNTITKRQSNPTGPFKMQLSTPPFDGHSVSPYQGQFLAIRPGSVQSDIISNATADTASTFQFSATTIQTTVDGTVLSLVIVPENGQIILAPEGTTNFGNNIPSTAAHPTDPGLFNTDTDFKGWSICQFSATAVGQLFAEIESFNPGDSCSEVDILAV